MFHMEKNYESEIIIMEIKKFDILTIDNKEFAVASIINYEENTYYYISCL